MIFNRFLTILLCSIICTFNIGISSVNAANTDIDDGITTLSSNLTDGDSLTFIGSSSGILSHDAGAAAIELSSISTNNDGVGSFTLDNNTNFSIISVSGDIGSAAKEINNIDFAVQAGRLQVTGSIYASSITNSSNFNNVGTLELYGSNSFVQASIGSSNTNSAINKVAVNAENITFSGDIYADVFTIVSSSSAILSNTTNVIGDLIMIDSSSSLTIDAGSQVSLSTAMDIEGTLNIGILSTASGTNAAITDSSGSVAGTIATDNDVTINFDYSDATNISTSDNYAFISGFGSLTTTNTINVTDNSILLVSAVDQSDSTQLSLTTSVDSSTTSQLSSRDSSTLTLLLNSTSISDISAVQTGLFQITTQSELDESLSSFQLGNNNMVQMASLDITNQINNIVDDRLHSINLRNQNNHFNKTSSKNDAGLWGDVFGNKVSQGSINGAKGYNSGTGGVIFGFDKVSKNKHYNLTMGSSLAYANAFVNSDAYSNQKTSIDSYQASIYSHIVDYDGLGFYNSSSLNIGYNKYDSSRTITAGTYQETADADFYALQYGAKTAFGYNFKVGKDFILSSDAGVKYSGISLSNYSETGAGDVGLNVNHSYLDFVSSEIGLKLIGNLSSKVETQLSGNWSYKLNDKGAVAETSFIGDNNSSQESLGVNVVRSVYRFGTQLNIKTGENKKLVLRYDLERGDKFTNNIGSLQYVENF